MDDAQYGTLETPWGRVGLEVGAAGARRLRFDAPPGPPMGEPWAGALAGYCAGRPLPDRLPVDLAALPPFTRRVLEACRAIPFGTTVSYGELARRLGCPRAARAVGQALARNPAPLLVPCHRVVGAGGALTGFLGGLAWKRALLRHEGARPAAEEGR